MTMMKSPGSSHFGSLKVAVGLLALLLLLATLQYHWLGQVSQAEQQRMQMSLSSAVERFANDFNREVTRALLYFFTGPDPSVPTFERQTRFVEQFRRWSDETPYPDLIRNLFLVNLAEGEARDLKKLDPGSNAFVEVDWPGELSNLRLRLAESFPPRDQRPGPGWRGIIDEEVPAILLPVSPPWIRGERRPNRPRLPDAFLIIQLDLGYMTRNLIPELVGRHFIRGDEIDYELAITSATEPEKVIYASRHDEAPMGSGDASAELLSPNLARARRDFLFQDIAPVMSERPGSERRGRPGMERLASAFRGGGGHWVLTVRHRAGSLEAAVDRARWRNLAVSFAILGLLGISVIMIIVSTDRARELARQKVEFVAGVSHELKTPLSVIRSAGQNLADGTIEESEQVKRYGSLVETEGRRLSDLVDQVLHFAGALSEMNPYQLETVSPGEIIKRALDDCRTSIQTKSVRVDEHVPDNLPMVRADRSALRRAIQNLLDNAVKFSGEEGRIELRAEDKGAEIEILVEDDGPGIPKAELAHIFEPFYRGRDAMQVHGSGLGLSLVKQIVEAHGGRVSAGNAPERGSRFRIHLPAVTES
jgi:signal transduction histidine kinase